MAVCLLALFLYTCLLVVLSMPMCTNPKSLHSCGPGGPVTSCESSGLISHFLKSALHLPPAENPPPCSWPPDTLLGGGGAMGDVLITCPAHCSWRWVITALILLLPLSSLQREGSPEVVNDGTTDSSSERQAEWSVAPARRCSIGGPWLSGRC
ncbi:hypothetical protein NHX12_005919 [Muraenolepis orangiensis]|uniref:Uncharacterized protein n=1 Tax=Muraenolepis orangiensis TaxID=630683 RepID=A0A9Q0DUT7_9TELE|nr:hypothetical protein NHX12_005919 [Muraenolepis orangiensis]